MSGFFFGRFPPGRAFGYIFYSVPLHKRMPPQSLTRKKGSKVQRLKARKVFNIKIEYPLAKEGDNSKKLCAFEPLWQKNLHIKN
jgi:hypothetical protein